MIELFTTAFITLAVIVDPPGCAPIFASLTRGADPASRRRMAIRSCVVAWCILMFFALLGEPLLKHMGISLSAFRLAGGIMLFIIALDMVFERRTERREERAREIEGTPEAEDVSVFPMAIPMIAGPGSIASIMLLNARAEGLPESLVVLGAMTLVILLTLAALLAAGPLMRFVGAKVEAMITRILGVILAALAVQFVLDGLERSLPGLAGA
jgi:multiple antibiotic resistance protein